MATLTSRSGKQIDVPDAPSLNDIGQALCDAIATAPPEYIDRLGALMAQYETKYFRSVSGLKGAGRVFWDWMEEGVNLAD